LEFIILLYIAHAIWLMFAYQVKPHFDFPFKYETIQKMTHPISVL